MTSIPVESSCIPRQVTVVLVSAALVGLLLGLCCFCYRRSQRELTREEEEEYIEAVQNFVKHNKRNM